MKVLTAWGWNKKYIPPEQRRKKKNLQKVFEVRCLNSKIDWQSHRGYDTVLVTGDGASLPDDVKRFESWGIDHDVYAANRSIMYFQRPVKHWAAVDAEESGWLAENMSANFLGSNGNRLLRHTIGICTIGYDIYWEAVEKAENEIQPRLWVGNTGYFAMLSALKIGYKRVVLAGMPLNKDRHWYETEETDGPNWVPETYTTWMDFKILRPEADQVRSMSGYSAFILGEAQKEWLT